MKQAQNYNEMVPDLYTPGKFSSNSDGVDRNAQGFLHPSNWVFHDCVTEPVLEGRYDKITPYSGEFVTTMNCTNRCESPCPFTEQKQIIGCWEKNDFMNDMAHMQTLDYAKRLLDKAKDGGIKGLIFTGGGEPTLFKYLGEAMKHASDIGIDTVLYTNLSGMSENQLEKIIDAKPLLIRGSLNAVSKDAYNTFHNPLNKETSHINALNTLEKIAVRLKDNTDTNFGVSFVIDDVTMHDLVNAAYALSDVVKNKKGKIDFTSFRPRFDYRGGNQLSKKVIEEMRDIVEEDVRPIIEGAGIECNSYRYNSLLKNTKKFDECRGSRAYAEIAPNGHVHVCCDNNAHPNYDFGNLNVQTIPELFSNKVLGAMLEVVNDTNCDICPPGCKPQALNNQLQLIEHLRSEGEIKRVEAWIKRHRDFNFPRMGNF